jgi:hypothetical protein
MDIPDLMVQIGIVTTHSLKWNLIQDNWFWNLMKEVGAKEPILQEFGEEFILTLYRA